MKNKIDYIKPANIAFEKMVKMLFKPFDIKKWFVLGFIAWITFFGEGGGFNYSIPSFDDNNNVNYSSSGNEQEIVCEDENASITTVESKQNPADEMKDFIKNLPDEISKKMSSEQSGIIILIGVIVLIAILFGIILGLSFIWLKARFSFIFLDNVIRDDTQISEPWHKFAKLGNSSFKWQAIFSFISICGVLIFLIIMGLSIAALFGPSLPLGIASLVISSLLFITFIIIFSVMQTFFRDFVTPIMYKNSITAIPAWKEFYIMLKNNKLAFLGYLGALIISKMVVGTVTIIITIATCCIASCIISIPYLGTVLLLPIPVFYRLYSVEFLAQFHENNEIYCKR